MRPLASLFVIATVATAAHASAQTAPPTVEAPSAEYPPTDEAPPASSTGEAWQGEAAASEGQQAAPPAPASTPTASDPAPAAPAPTPSAPATATAPQTGSTSPAYGAAPPGPYYGSPTPAAQPPSAPPPTYSSSPEQPPTSASADEEGEPFEMPAFSVRLDPFTWLFEAQLGLELEVQLWEFISLEFTPYFVTSDSAPGFPDDLRQSGEAPAGLGGFSIGPAFWFSGKPFKGYALRAYIHHEELGYDTSPFDPVVYEDTRWVVMLSSMGKIAGPLVIGGGFGIGRAFDSENERCVNSAPCGGEFQIPVSEDEYFDANGFLYPWSLEGRISLGLAFD